MHRKEIEALNNQISKQEGKLLSLQTQVETRQMEYGTLYSTLEILEKDKLL